MQIFQITLSLRKLFSYFVLFHSMILPTIRSDEHVTDAKSALCSFARRKCRNLRARISRRASVYFLCLPRARFNDNIALYNRKRVRNTRNTRAGIHGGDKYSIFRSYWDYVYFRVRKSLPFPHFIATNNAVIIRTHCQALRRILTQETSEKLYVSIWHHDPFGFVDADNTWV